jgi:hypothetical protein
MRTNTKITVRDGTEQARTRCFNDLEVGDLFKFPEGNHVYRKTNSRGEYLQLTTNIVYNTYTCCKGVNPRVRLAKHVTMTVEWE